MGIADDQVQTSDAHRARNEARADAFDCIGRVSIRRGRHSKPGLHSLMEFEARAIPT